MDATSRKWVVPIHTEPLLLAGNLHEELRDRRWIKCILNGIFPMKQRYGKPYIFL